jgi:diacylglycerol kinase family enzyme
MRVRALLIVNPRATTTTKPVLDVIVRTLAANADLEVVETKYRGNAREIAAEAVAAGWDALLVLSGDGTINEAVNGLMDKATVPAGLGATDASGADPSGADDDRATPAEQLPALGALPGGNANVFTRDLGVPPDPLAAVHVIAERLAAGTTRTVGLGQAGDRYFTFNAGLGWDAEVIHEVEDRRAAGQSASNALYMRAALDQYYRRTDRRHPSLSVQAADGHRIEPVAMALIANTSPWSYVGQHPMSPAPLASFDTGLDAFMLRRLRTISTLNTIRQMARRSGRPVTGRYAVTLHDQSEITVRSRQPAALQVDGDYVGDFESVTFRSVPDALRVIA